MHQPRIRYPQPAAVAHRQRLLSTRTPTAKQVPVILRRCAVILVNRYHENSILVKSFLHLSLSFFSSLTLSFIIFTLQSTANLIIKMSGLTKAKDYWRV